VSISWPTDDELQSLLISVPSHEGHVSRCSLVHDEQAGAVAITSDLPAAVGVGGLTPDRAASLDAARFHLLTMAAGLDAVESDLRDVAIAAMGDEVGVENVALAQRELPHSAFTQAQRDALAAARSNPTVILAQHHLDANLADAEAACSSRDLHSRRESACSKFHRKSH
jgi:hypothetical protein